MKDRFYLLCTRDTVGSRAAFHGIKGHSYVTDLDKAEVYTREEAQRAWNSGREIDLPVSADHLDALSEWRVDCQHVGPSDLSQLPADTEYVAYCKGAWDGNDLYWVGESSRTLNVLQAKRFKEPDLSKENLVWLPWAVVDSKKRRTVAISEVNRRTMIQGAGLKQPEWLVKSKRRKGSVKTRMNCPGCGKLHWQFDPHTFHGCNDTSCKYHHESSSLY